MLAKKTMSLLEEMTTVVKDEKVLEVKDLRTYFYTQEGELKAVDGLTYYVNKGESVGVVGESAPFSRDERGVVVVLSRPDDAHVLIERKGDLGLEGQAGAFEDDLGGQFTAHVTLREWKSLSQR